MKTPTEAELETLADGMADAMTDAVRLYLRGVVKKAIMRPRPRAVPAEGEKAEEPLARVIAFPKGAGA
jgi:hypothetical protein